MVENPNLCIYRAATENVRELKKNEKILNKMINSAIKSHNDQELQTLTKLYLLLFSTYAEASFLKLIYTPYGFSEEEIYSIKQMRNLEAKWEKCIELCLKKLKNKINKGEVQNKNKRLKDLVEVNIIQNSQIRNKIAHGQWHTCLNSSNTKISEENTTKLESIDAVKISLYFEIYEKIQQCIEDIIESRETHYRDYYVSMVQIEKIENIIASKKDWNLETKKKKLLNSKKYKNMKQRY